MSERKVKKGHLNPANICCWGRLFLVTIFLDEKHDKPRGWHLSCALYALQDRISNFDIEKMQKVLPDEHKLTNDNISNALKYLSKHVGFFKEASDSPKTISQIDLSHMLFEKDFDFADFIFPMEVSFENSQFSFDLSFSNAIFCDTVIFKGVNFINKANFEKTLFNGDVFFEDAQFHREATFKSATFSHVANFMGANFLLYTVFHGARFSGTALFIRATFSYPIEFDKALFSNEAYFSEAKFSKGVNFTEAVFYMSVDFTDTSFNSVAGFKKVIFFGVVSFKNANFAAHTHFSGSEFKECPPDFYETTLSADITWDSVKWPNITVDTERGIIHHSQVAYESLSYQMKTLDKYHDQHFFFRQGMRCRWRLINCLSFRRLAHYLTWRQLGEYLSWKQLEKYLAIAFYWLYENLADYGYGVERAFGFWLLHNIVGILIIGVMVISNASSELSESLRCSIPVAFANTSHYAFIGIEDGSLMKCYERLEKLAPIGFGTIRVFQTLFGAFFLFLFLATLRIRFRLK